jgi:hypothetical protein
VFINNLDDFILPSQDCINPLIASKRKEAAAASSSKKKILLVNDESISEFELSSPSYGSLPPNLINIKYDQNQQRIASVSLNDCLACRSINSELSHSQLSPVVVSPQLKLFSFKNKVP